MVANGIDFFITMTSYCDNMTSKWIIYW